MIASVKHFDSKIVPVYRIVIALALKASTIAMRTLPAIGNFRQLAGCQKPNIQGPNYHGGWCVIILVHMCTDTRRLHCCFLYGLVVWCGSLGASETWGEE